MDIDWTALRVAATEAMRRAYAPYSRFPVGAAALVDDGRVVTGCNVENASYGTTLCAECGVVSQLHASGGGRLVALACVDGSGAPLMPCGRCRQLLWEHGGPDCLVDAGEGPRAMAELLPDAFDVADLDAASERPAHAPVVPARFASWRGRGTVIVHPDLVNGVEMWTGYWERAEPGAPPPGDGPRIIEEAPTWGDVTEAVAWGRARTERVVVIDDEGAARWAGGGDPPPEAPRRWAASGGWS
ncbi:cytidine deaminase [Pilimelia columellifera]|uniref:Cytidine deaminase n=1 Tax=Pilimelia columellifera subsp. columellifera TaxID=706583 RepID=A0ABP6AUT4_9ACTN